VGPNAGAVQQLAGVASLQTKHRPRVVIIGAGFGGLEAARALRNAAVDITLIDRRNFHLFQPLLYQVATAALSPGDIAWPTRSIFRRHPNITVLMAEVSGVDTETRFVTDGKAQIPYDFLILATGAAHSYFGHDEWSAFALALKTVNDALTIREKLLLAFERAELSTDSQERRRLMTTVIVGGGATGVEMAGAIAELDHRTLLGEFRHVDTSQARIILIEAGPRVLAGFSEEMSAIARRSLESMRVEVRTGVSVSDCNLEGVTLAGGDQIEAGTIIWAAGVAASPAGAWIGTACDRAGRVEVCPDLSVTNHPEIFVIGDTARVHDGTQRPVPGVAPAAKQMGRHVGKAIAARIQGRAPARAFKYRNLGDLAAIGRKSALVSIGRFRLTGFLGWMFWCVAHIWFLIGFRSRFVVAFSWFWSYLTFQRGARLISDRDRT
jgi:NADH:ubiquinone reductase (H+-translocating)